MRSVKLTAGLLVLTLVVALSGCASNSARQKLQAQTGESVVLAGETPGKLAFTPAAGQPVVVRSTYLNEQPSTTSYEVGRDYVLEAAGQIRRTANSRIPDYSTNLLYGKEDFRHDQFPGYGNQRFFVYVDYRHQQKWALPAAEPELGAARLPQTLKKLRAGEHVRMIAFGDSITAGGEASEPKLIFWERWADWLRQKYPRATLESINGATGGDTTAQGLQRLQAKVLDQHPDLVLIGFGMNDHNVPNFGVPLAQFTDNLRTLVDRVRSATGAEVVLFSAFPPNPKWHYGSHNMEAYAAATEQVAREKQCAFADVYRVWMSIAERKKPEDLLGNNINHPNDFGHGLYFEAFRALGL
jgi:acyl-CoA thioesterase I